MKSDYGGEVVRLNVGETRPFGPTAGGTPGTCAVRGSFFGNGRSEDL